MIKWESEKWQRENGNLTHDREGKGHKGAELNFRKFYVPADRLKLDINFHPINTDEERDAILKYFILISEIPGE